MESFQRSLSQGSVKSITLLRVLTAFFTALLDRSDEVEATKRFTICSQFSAVLIFWHWEAGRVAYSPLRRCLSLITSIHIDIWQSYSLTPHRFIAHSFLALWANSEGSVLPYYWSSCLISLRCPFHPPHHNFTRPWLAQKHYLLSVGLHHSFGGYAFLFPIPLPKPLATWDSDSTAHNRRTTFSH